MIDEEQKRLAEELFFSEEKKPSFAKRLYFGAFDAKSVFPYPKADGLAFAGEVATFADTQIDADWIDRNATIPDTVLQGLSKMGVMGMTVPEDLGGLGMSQRAYCKVTEELARRCGSTALFVNVQQSIGLKSILLFGTEEQKSKWLRPLARGEKLAAFSLTEPNAGSDASGVETRAEFDAEKNVYRINGRKQWTTNGGIADVLTVMAQTRVGDRDKITAFLITPDMPGFKVDNPSLEKVGMRGTKTANLHFENVEVPPENILGPLGGGLRVCLTVLDYGRTTFGSTCTGVAKELVERAIHHAKTRHQFKKPLAAFPLVKKKIAEMSALAYAMEATTHLTAGLVDAGVEDVMLEAAMLKVFASDAVWKILYDTMQIMGGRSFFTDEPYERMMRDARLNMIGEGSNEVLRAFIGAVGMRDVGMRLQEGVESLFSRKSPIWELGKQWVQTPTVPIRSSLFQKEGIALARAVQRFGWAVVRLLKHYREDVVERQLELDRIATSAMAIYTSTAVLSRLDSENPSATDIMIGKFYCKQAMDTVAQQLGALFSKDDLLIEGLSDQITGLV